MKERVLSATGTGGADQGDAPPTAAAWTETGTTELPLPLLAAQVAEDAGAGTSTTTVAPPLVAQWDSRNRPQSPRRTGMGMQSCSRRCRPENAPRSWLSVVVVGLDM